MEEHMRNYFKLAIALVFIMLACTACTSNSNRVCVETDAVSNNGVGDMDLLNILQSIREEYDLPAMAAALVTDQGLQRVAAVGTRKCGTDNPVTLDDLWHLGSDTKIMTATLAAILVEEGKLQWTTTVNEVFPEIIETSNPGFRDVNLLQLLSHEAGLPRDIEYSSISQSIPIPDQRLEVVRMAFNEEPLYTPGTQFQYSNVGYVIVGAMIERITDMDWETAITQNVFLPLKMTSAGFGGLGTPGMIDQPWGHYPSGEPAASNGPDDDIPLFTGPAGTVYCTIQDWALFIEDQLRGAQGEPGLLSSESYQMLQNTHFDSDYALGWSVAWPDGKVLYHGGSNGMYLTNVVINPEKNFAVLVCTNEGGDDSYYAEDEVIREIIINVIE